jgi:superfamily II DNA or RNA helicase
MSDYLRHLLIQRARIAKKASLKTPRACDLVVQNWRDGDHWLLYCEDSAQLQAVLTELRRRGIDALEYHTGMRGSRSATLDRYKRTGGVIVSIRCLDEGVDIPDLSHALILASSRNEREFVQRRGRVLRKAPGKHEATVYDLLVVPGSMDANIDHYDGLVYGEIARAALFAQDAANVGALTFLKRLAITVGLDPTTLDADGFEDESEEEV